MMDDYILQHVAADEVHGYRRRRTLRAGRTAVQSFEIAEIGGYGRALLLDGCVQSTEHDERIYHESLIFPAFAHSPEIRTVLCLGGANGGTLKQINKLPALERVLLFDIDAELHEISRELLPHMHEDTLADPRFTMEFGDVAARCQALADRGASFDLIVADLPDATAGSYSVSLFSREFYDLATNLLSPHGIYVTQAGQAHFRNSRFLNRTMRTLCQAFAYAVPYSVIVPSYGCPWAFALASHGVDFRAVSAGTIQRRIALLPAASLDSYDYDTHVHMFHLPKPLRTALAERLPVLTLAQAETVQVAVEPAPGGAQSR